ncbi:MAG: ATP-binding cassette domain-containing protein, partial [Alphaproteobacteria bacterium]|nr:ATP-binding cassette domain-containing protein [Alphaproteobacteria bacterium]
DNLLIGLRRPPPLAVEGEAQSVTFDLASAERPIDFGQAGVKDAAALDARLVEVLKLVGLENEVYGFGLHGRLVPAQEEALAPRILEARSALGDRLQQTGMARLVERFDPDRYNTNATVAQNLLFGAPVGPSFEDDGLARNAHVIATLDRHGLTADLLRIGREVAQTMVEIFADLRRDHEIVEEFSLVRPQELPFFEAILARIGRAGPDALEPEEREALISLSLKLVAARHRLGLIDETMQRRIVEARRTLMQEMPSALRPALEFFEAERYNAAATVQENLLFGKIAYGEANARERVRELIGEVIDALGLREAIIQVGLNYNLGSGGARLPLAQRQRVAIARAVLKRPDLLVLNEATAVLDEAAQVSLLQGLNEEFAGRGLIWSLHRIDLARHFDLVLVLENGRLAGQGPYEEVKPEALLARPIAAE